MGILFCNDAFDYPDFEIHHSTLIKFDKLISTSKPALPEVTINFQFVCRSTCKSVVRRPLEWVLMLEDAR
jgi:P53 DNA-binding domain